MRFYKYNSNEAEISEISKKRFRHDLKAVS